MQGSRCSSRRSQMRRRRSGAAWDASRVAAAKPQTEQIQQLWSRANELQKMQEKPTIEQVLHFLQDNRAKAFVLDIETDTTIMPDEKAEKQRRNEFMQVLGGLLPQLSQMIAAEPRTGNVLRRNAQVCHRTVSSRPAAGWRDR